MSNDTQPVRLPSDAPSPTTVFAAPEVTRGLTLDTYTKCISMCKNTGLSSTEVEICIAGCRSVSDFSAAPAGGQGLP